MSLAYFPFYPVDYEADTAHLSLEEDGAYNRLLRLCWLTPGCSLPDDPAWIMRRMRVDAATYERVVSVVLSEFFKRRRGRVYSPRLMAIFDETNAAHKRRVNAGRKGGRPPKALKDNETDESNAKALSKQPEPEPEPYTEGKPSVSCSKPQGLPFDAFWAVWPNKSGKEPARKAWAKLNDDDRRKAQSFSASWFARWRKTYPTASPILPASYLNGRRWEDEAAPNVPPTAPPARLYDLTKFKG